MNSQEINKVYRHNINCDFDVDDSRSKGFCAKAEGIPESLVKRTYLAVFDSLTTSFYWLGSKQVYFYIAIITMFVVLVSIADASDKIRIGIIDSTIDISKIDSTFLCDGLDSIKDFTPKKRKVINQHARNVYSLITKNMNQSESCVIVYQVWQPRMFKFEMINSFIRGLTAAKNDKLDFLNISMSGYEIIKGELGLYRQIIKNTKIIVAAGNHSTHLGQTCDVYPACYSPLLKSTNFVVVGCYQQAFSNFGKVVNIAVYCNRVGVPKMTGTSQATAIMTNHFIKYQFRRLVIPNDSRNFRKPARSSVHDQSKIGRRFLNKGVK